MTRATLILLCVFLGGCSVHAKWTKVGATPADVEKAKAECEFEAAKHDVSLMNTTWMSELDQMRLITLCMKSKGFTS